MLHAFGSRDSERLVGQPGSGTVWDWGLRRLPSPLKRDRGRKEPDQAKEPAIHENQAQGGKDEAARPSTSSYNYNSLDRFGRVDLAGHSFPVTPPSEEISKACRYHEEEPTVRADRRGDQNSGISVRVLMYSTQFVWVGV